MIQLTITGPFPSKKNAWRRRAGGKAYLPPQMQADIDALIIQAQSAKQHFNRKLHEEVLAADRIGVRAEFHVCDSLKDLDNVYTTVLDVLQKAGVIENDRKVKAFQVEEVDGYGPGEEKVELHITPLARAS